MEWPPVRRSMARMLAVALAVLTGVLGWGHADRGRLPSEQLAGPRSNVATEPAARPVGRRPASQAKPETRTESAVRHVIRPGETLSGISRLYGVSVADITKANQIGSDLIRHGDVLLVPGAQPLRKHRVKQGDSLWELANRYGVSLEDLLQANRDVNPGHLQNGQELVIPHSRGVARVPEQVANDTELSLGGLFAWPVMARISSEFGLRWGRNHNGVDLAANHGDEFRASRHGKVLLAGDVPGYGLTIVMEHPDGSRTLYAHSSKILVRAGDTVKQGQVIGLVGSTGASTGPHLHFEIIVNGKPRDPLLYLPKFQGR